MTDRVPGAPGQYSAVIRPEELEKLQNGENFTITLTRDDQPVTPGTPYSKAAVLPDELAEKLCPGVEDPAPKDALEALYNSKAPAGCGYGDAMIYLSAEDGTFDEKLEAIYAEMPNFSAKQLTIYDPQGLTGYKFIATLWRYTADYGTLEAVTYHGLKAIKCKYKTWQVWEWVNPPMLEGVEYRTTGRYNGAVVYCKHISHESTVDYGGNGVSTVEIPHNISGSYVRLVSCDARHDGAYLLPIVTSGGGVAAVAGIHDGMLLLRFSNCTFGPRVWKFSLYYTKG